MILPGTGRGAQCVAMPGAWRKREADCVAAVGRSMVEGGRLPAVLCCVPPPAAPTTLRVLERDRAPGTISYEHPLPVTGRIFW